MNLSEIFNLQLNLDDFASREASKKYAEIDAKLIELQKTKDELENQYTKLIEYKTLAIWGDSKFKNAHETFFGEGLPKFLYSTQYNDYVENEEQYSLVSLSMIRANRRKASEFHIGIEFIVESNYSGDFDIWIFVSKDGGINHIKLEKSVLITPEEVKALQEVKDEIEMLKDERKKNQSEIIKNEIFDRILIEKGINKLDFKPQKELPSVDGL